MKYKVYGVVEARTCLGVFDAENADDAVKEASSCYPRVVLCKECRDEVQAPEIISYYAYPY